MFKTLVFQLHWLLGITAGTVLALMGLTGATLSFQDELLRWSDPGLARIAQRQQAGELPLPLPELVQRLGVDGGQGLNRLIIDPSGARPSRLRLESPAPGQPRERYFDPYTGQELPAPRGMAFFHVVEDLHRRLAAGERGKAVTGACVLALVFFCLSGLYLRWPRRWWNWRVWLAVEWRRDGRSFLWSLHSVIGTWCLLLYLVIALTGLYWSYDWYRAGLVQVLGGPAREQPRGPRGTAPPPLDLAGVQRVLAQLPDRHGTLVDLRVPASGTTLTLRTRSAGAAHDRAYDSIELDRASGQVLRREPYAAQPPGRKLLTSIFALHSGSFFGLAGRLAWMLAALCMSLFFVTGWMLYLDRRRKKRALRNARGGLAAPRADGEPWLVAFASQSGFAEQLAWQTAGQLQAAGQAVRVSALGQLDHGTLQATRRALFVVSTFGDGEPPDAARGVERALLRQAGALPQLGYALLALGDRQYARFCGFSRRLDQWLAGQGANALFPTIEVDNADPVALAQWQRQLGDLTGVEAAPMPLQSPPPSAWTMRGRTPLNPGSDGAPVWRIDLLPPPQAHWQAGDILLVQPQHAPDTLRTWLAAHALDAATAVHVDGRDVALAEALATRVLPAAADAALPVQAWLETLSALPPREYSIASVPADGVLQLVVREVIGADGRPGLGSGWLCRHAPVGTELLARVRANPGFRRHGDAPMVLIGNGTGIAGLRSLLREAANAGSHGHWLLFGERHVAHDRLFGDELAAWRAAGHLQRLDLAFSRDQPHKVYVQHLLRDAADMLPDWLARGAVLHVCGSLVGMAQEVDAELRRQLGDAVLDTLAAQGRYRRDVY